MERGLLARNGPLVLLEARRRSDGKEPGARTSPSAYRSPGVPPAERRLRVPLPLWEGIGEGQPSVYQQASASQTPQSYRQVGPCPSTTGSGNFAKTIDPREEPSHTENATTDYEYDNLCFIKKRNFPAAPAQNWRIMRLGSVNG